MSQGFEISVNKAQFERLLETASQAALDAMVKDFGGVRWWWVADDAMILDATTDTLWRVRPMPCSPGKVSQQVAGGDVRGIKGWSLPTQQQIQSLYGSGFPLSQGDCKRILGADAAWIKGDNQAIWLDDRYPQIFSPNQMIPLRLEVLELFPSASLFRHFSSHNISRSLFGKFITDKALRKCAEHNWSVNPHGVNDPQQSSFQNLYVIVLAHTHKRFELLRVNALRVMYTDLDYNSVRLPKMDALRFTDPYQGLWEFYARPGASGDRQTLHLPQQLRARNPEDDIRDGYVAIDFGTSSTVVAFKEQGRDQLLRIGLSDFSQSPQPKHYENPTVLEFLDFARLLADWQGQAYRPMVSWDSVHCSHEARASLRDNDTNPKVVGSVMERLKQWALRGSQPAVVSITDQDNGLEYRLAPLTERDPVKGKPLAVGADYPFDPIELYAWFLGMTINWRSRGLFLHYFMTFPVKYSNEVKRKILSSFRRGLQRSLPDTLLASPRFAEFSLEERASEPAAFAASALQAYGIEPTVEGVAYAVFDFGGGTTDFDYGYYRLPTDTEVQRNIEHVLEHFGADGDVFLSGENLLEYMAYQVFCDNLAFCRSNEIAFTSPLDAGIFPGSEALIVRTQSAIFNTRVLMSRLRHLWEKCERNNTNTVKIKLLDRQGVSVDCDFSIDEGKLLEYLRTRIRQGLLNFFTAMNQAFTRQGDNAAPRKVHVLLAGNTFHSPILQEMFGIHPKPESEAAKALRKDRLADMAEMFGDEAPEFVIHPPLFSDAQNLNKPNVKTGVALGLLKLCPGETLLEIYHNRHSIDCGEECSLQYHVGGFLGNNFRVRLKRGAHSGGEWRELGVVRDRLFNLVFTQTVNALNNSLRRGDFQLTVRRLTFPAAADGEKVFARAHGPDSIELVTAVDLAAAKAGRVQHAQVLTLR